MQLYAALPGLVAVQAFSDAIDTPIVHAAHGDSSGVRGAARTLARPLPRGTKLDFAPHPSIRSWLQSRTSIGKKTDQSSARQIILTDERNRQVRIAWALS